MHAWRLAGYNPEASAAIKALKMEKLPVPKPGPNEVRVKVEYSAVNPIDWKLMTGAFDAMFPAAMPYTPGLNVAGTVDAVGEGVTGPLSSTGCHVVADLGFAESCTAPPPARGSCGGFAEYCIAPAGSCAPLAEQDDTGAMAGLAMVGLTAYQGLFTGGNPSDLGRLEAGDKLLVLGGSSSVGSMAIQLAKQRGLGAISATASANKMPDGTSKIDWVRSLGAEVIDYKAEDWADVLEGQGYDLIFDTVGDNADWQKAHRVLKPGGKFVSLTNFTPDPAPGEGAGPNAGLGFSSYIYAADGGDLGELVSMAEAHQISAHVDSVYELSQVPEALEKSLGGRAGGKIVVKVAGRVIE